jgi:hypothetical protein
MSPILSFRLKLAGTDKFSGFSAVSTSFRVHGLLRLEGEQLVIQWGGTVQVQEVGLLSLQDESEVLPIEQVVVPVSDLYRATLAGGWWRPRLKLEARELAALGAVPSEQYGRVEFWYARHDRMVAVEMADAINEAIAMVSGHAIAPPSRSIGSESTPPSGLTS